MEIPEPIDVDAWYSAPVYKIRVTTPTGGDALSIQEAKKVRDTLSDLIDHAEAQQE